jgi:xylulokinase
MSLLGLDVGTGGSRAIVVADDGQVIASATRDHAPFRSPRTGWAEHDPDDWWRASSEAVRAVVSATGKDPIRALGLSGQMHGAVLLDAAGDVLRPAIIWCDQRTGVECRELTERIGAHRVVELTANPALTGFTLPKLLWVRRHEPAIWSKVCSVLLPKDYVRLQLTGERATDMADASGTLLFDVANRRWSDAMLRETGIDCGWLPAAFEGPTVTGVISSAAAAETGLRTGLPVVAGGGDQAAGAIGMGVVRPGTVSVTIGTSGVVFAATDAPARDPLGRVHTFCHAVPGRWHVMGVTQAAGLSLRWFRDTFGVADASRGDAFDSLAEEASRAGAGADGVLWAPYLMGERTPHRDPGARAALVGLAASHTRAHIVRAILEGVAFSQRDSFEILAAMRVPVDRVLLGGGGARSPLWRQIHADVLGVPVGTLRAEEGAAFGAALLAGVGAGVWPSVETACDQTVVLAGETRPNPANVRVMAEQYRRYRALYPALRQVIGPAAKPAPGE